MTSSMAAPTRYLLPNDNIRRTGPRPLPSLPSRNHTLTPPPSAQSPIKPNGSSNPSTPPTSLAQTQSLLLSLPPELRLQIYTSLLGGPNVPVHIVRTRTRLTSIRCWMPHEQRSRHGCLGTIESNGIFVGWLGAGPKHYGNNDGRTAVGMQGMLPLLQTCRFLYTEAIVLLYKMPMFMLSNTEVLPGWKECVLAKRFAAVRALDLGIFVKLASMFHGGAVLQDDERIQGLWRVVRGMEGLRRLRVRLCSRVTTIPWRLEEEILDSLERFEQVQDFEVLVSWKISDGGEGSAVHERKQRPFRLVKFVAATWGEV